jgi:ribosome-associated protein
MDNQDLNAFEQEETKSRTKHKLEAQNINKLASELVQLTKAKLQKLSLSEKAFDEIIKAQSMQRIALKRQIGFIAKILRKEDIDDLLVEFKNLNEESNESKAKLHQLEKLRENLIDEQTSKNTLSSLIEDHPGIDVQKIRQLIRKAQVELKKENGSPKYSREIFKILKGSVL